MVQLHLLRPRCAAALATSLLTVSVLAVPGGAVSAEAAPRPVPVESVLVESVLVDSVPAESVSPAGRDTSALAVVRDGSGRVRLLGARAGHTLAVAPSGVRGPARAARIHLRRFGALFGPHSPAGLRAREVTATASGHDVVRFQQTVRGLPVIGAELVVVLDGSAALVSVGGETTRRVQTSAYDVLASRAARTAARTTARAHHLLLSTVSASRPTRWLYDASLVDPRGAPGARAVWRVEVTAPGRPDVRALVLVDAATGTVALHVDQVAYATERVICDNADVPSSDYDCRAGQYDRTEGAAPTGVPDIDQVYDLTGATSDWFASRLGVDLTALIGHDNGDGRKLRSTTRYCPRWGCPLDNAFWSGEQMVYGSGYTSADDVVAHELSHGVTQNTAGLMYWFQAGAINESMSDVFGELVDLADGVGTDTEEVRWQLGEDLSPRAGGLARDMSDPPRRGQPDHTGSDLYDPAEGFEDNGGVHTNSGVPNKTAYLVSEGTAGEPGGAFNGASFPGIGTDKTGLLYWSTLQMLTPGADFADLAATLQQACANLAAAATAGMTTTDCLSVVSAATATGLTRWVGPSEPRDVTMTPGARSVRLTWKPPASQGSSPVSSYAVHVRPAVGEEDFFPLRPSARSFRVPKLAVGTDYTVGLVAVSSDGTSPSVVNGFTGTALQVGWPSTVPYRSRSTVGGVLTGSGATPAPGRVVRLLRRDAGRSSYVPVASATTAADGTFGLVLTARRAASFAVSYAGSSGEIGARSANHQVRVRMRVSLVAEPAGAGTVRFRGTVTPARAGAAVRLQSRLGPSDWRTVALDRLSGAGTYQLSTPVRSDRPQARVWRVRAVAPGRSGLLAGLSREVSAPSGGRPKD